ncbi:MAG: hypothetical protein ACFE68_03385 [Candidatus Hodarchaeota archaeon]
MESEEIVDEKSVEVEEVEKEEEIIRKKGLHLLVEYSDTEDIILGSKNEIKNYESKGAVGIINPAVKENVWKIHFDVESSNTSMKPGSYVVGDILAATRWSRGYALKTTSALLTLKEEIDADFSEEEEPNFARKDFIFNKMCKTLFRITLENSHENLKLSNINLRKKMPEILDFPPRILEPFKGSINFDDLHASIAWKIKELNPGETTVLNVVGVGEIIESEKIGTGDINVDYKVHNGDLSNTKFSLDSLCRIMFYVEASEAEEPGVWNCIAQFEGNDEFETLLEHVKITKEDQSVLDEYPNEIVSAGESWSSGFQVKSDEPPVFTKSIKYRVPWDIKSLVKSHIRKIEDQISVVRITCQKTFVPETVRTYARTKVTITSTVTNQGTSTIDLLKIKETIPQYFTLDPTSVTVTSNGYDLKDALKLEGGTGDPLEDKPVTFILKNLKNSNMGGLKPRLTLAIKYEVEAVKPVPGKTYHFPIEVEVFPSPPTKNPATTIAFTPKGIPPEVGVTYTKRSIGVGKSITHIAGGTFEVMLLIKNPGAVAIENILVEDAIPYDFDFENYEPKSIVCESKDAGKEKIFCWKISKIEPGGKIIINYKVKGTGELPNKEPKATVLG